MAKSKITDKTKWLIIGCFVSNENNSVKNIAALTGISFAICSRIINEHLKL